MTAPLVFLPGWCLGRGPLNAAVNALNGTILDLPGYGAAPPVSYTHLTLPTSDLV